MKTSLYSLLALSFLGLSAGCRPANNGEQSDAGAQAIINSGYAWPGGSVEVCHLNTPQNSDALRGMRAALVSNFQKSNVGIEFTGFKPCDQAPNAPAKVYFFPTNSGRAYSKYIGTYKVFYSLDYDKYGATIALPDDGSFYLYNTAIHEFGHFAGLFHEQSRLENFNGSLCSRQEQGNFEKIPQVLPGALPKQVGEFDRMSIMNYCVQGYFTQPLKLSAGDITALRTLYKASLPTNTTPTNTGVNPAELCNIIELSKAYYVDRPTAPAYSDENMATSVGEIQVGTRMSRLLTKPINNAVGKGQENLTVIQVIPSSGSLSGKKVWILGNLTQVVGCREVK